MDKKNAGWYNKRKHRLSSGESISEVLVASLLISLAMTALISMVMASSRMVRNSESAMNQYYSIRNSYESDNAAGGGSGKFRISLATGDADEQPVSIKIHGNDTTVSFIGYDIP